MNLKENINRIKQMMGIINESKFFRRRIDLNNVKNLLGNYASQVYYETKNYKQFKYELVLKVVERIMWKDYKLDWAELPEQEEIEFVTKISNAVVRTTHLTGLFTDLGIDISQLFFPKLHHNREKLKSQIKLRIYIILFFFAGGFIGGFLYSQLHFALNTLIFATLILLASLFFDDFRYKIIKTRRKYTRKSVRA